MTISKLKISVIAVMGLLLLSAMAQGVLAGGGELTWLSFPGSGPTTCGSWESTGSLSTDAAVDYIMYDGTGIVVALGSAPSVHGSLAGEFTLKPASNPLYLVVYSSGYQVGNVVANNVCLTPVMTPTPIVLTPYMTPIFQPTGLPPVVCPGAPQPRLLIGMEARVTPGLPNSLRNRAGLNRDGSRIIGSIPGGEDFTVLDGPVCISGYLWWQVEYNGAVGWTAEGRDRTYWLEPLS